MTDIGNLLALPSEILKKILSEYALSPRDILNIGTTRTRISDFDHDDNFWQNIVHLYYQEIQSSGDVLWKQLFIFLVNNDYQNPRICLTRVIRANYSSLVDYYLNKLPASQISSILEQLIILAINRGQVGIIKQLTAHPKLSVDDNFWRDLILIAIDDNHPQLVDHFLSLIANWGIINWNTILFHSVKISNEGLIDIALSQGATDYNLGLYGAACVNNLPLVKFFLDKEATNVNAALSGAIRNHHPNMINYLISLGANDWYNALTAAIETYQPLLISEYVQLLCPIPNDRGKYLHYALCHAVAIGNKAAIYQLFNLGLTNVNDALITAVSGNNQEIIDLLINLGANNYNNAMLEAMEKNRPDLVKYLVTRGADDYNQGMVKAIATNQGELVYYFISRGANAWYAGWAAAHGQKNKHFIRFFRNKFSQVGK